ncbi:MAG: MFS transporter, partial [Actinomycetaceae bacterium]
VSIGLGLLALALTLPGLLPPGALRLRPRVPALVTGRALLNGAFIAVEVFLVLMLQEQHGWDAMSAGIVLTVGSLSWGAASVVAARIRTEATRATLPWIGTAMLGLGIVISLPAAWPAAPPWLTIVGWVVAGGGIGLAMSASSVLALGWTPRERQGEVSAHLQIADSLGAAVLVALTGIAVAVAPSGSDGQLPYVAALGIALALALVGTLAAHRSQGDRSELGR